MKTNKLFSQFLIANYFLLSLLVTSCQSQENSITSETINKNYIKLEGTALGTFFHITYLQPENKNFSTEIDSLFHAFNASLSTYQDNSIISKVNKNEEVELDYYFITCFNKAREVFEKTNGAFDITIAPIVNAYGFGFTKKETVDKQKIDSLLQFVGMNKVRVENNKLIKDFKGTMLDGNAIAKGYCVDVIANYLQEQKCKNYMVEIGGEIVTKGRNPKNNSWRIGIDQPIENSGIEVRELQEIIDISDWALATSGNYRKFYEENGIKYSHSISPTTGESIQRKLLSATIIAKDCITADAYATACMIIGLEESLKLIESLPSMEAYFISSDENGEYVINQTKGMQSFIEK